MLGGDNLFCRRPARRIACDFSCKNVNGMGFGHGRCGNANLGDLLIFGDVGRPICPILSI